ncbi:MAG: glutamate racemase [Spirochaetales bacterium]|jgi:glutamate racemase|nr:glutamate racemase [Spirochaetales bacterium]
MPAAILTNSSDKVRSGAPIAFLDSGVGGLPYLQWVRVHLPEENFIYLADREHFPYGPKSPDKVFSAVAGCVEKFITAFAPKLFVLACNTASVSALERLRRTFPAQTFVGTVPAVKPAAECSKNKRIGVLATNATVHAHYFDSLIETFASGCTIIRVPGPDIVNFVEKKFFTAAPEEKLRVIAAAVNRFREEGVDTVVLACTHFLYLYPEIHAELGGGVRLIDSREGVGRRVINIVSSFGPRAQAPAPRIPGLYLSGGWSPEPQYAFFAEYFSLELAGTL